MLSFLAVVKAFFASLLSIVAVAFSFNAAPIATTAPPIASTTHEIAPAVTGESASTTTAPAPEKPKSAAAPAKKPPEKKKAAPKVGEPDAKPLETSASTPEPAATSSRVVPYPSTVSDRRIKDSLVNIICVLDRGDTLVYSSGTGVIVSPSGIIITNAHVAQHFLLSGYLKSGKEQCAIRNGNPARKHYTAELLYIPPAWIRENYKGIVGDEPQGTGENDYAFLVITSTTDGSPLPASFTHLPVSVDPAMDQNDVIVAAGYPAEFIPAESVNTNLYGVSLPTRIQDVYTFTETTIDLIQMNGGYLAQRGASGGPVVNSDGGLIGIVVTASLQLYDGERHLNAITTGHIDRSLDKYTGKRLKSVLEGDPRAKAAEFARSTAPELEALLMTAIEK